MLKFYHYSAFFLSAIMTGSALADCSTPTYNRLIDLKRALRGNKLCYPNHQEEHLGNGTLRDTKTGDLNDPVDPRIAVGTWAIINGTGGTFNVEYNYSKGGDSAGPFIFTPHNNGDGTISFCNGNSLSVTATVVDRYLDPCP
ncbi:MAG: hypothetical protein GQ583_07430 [Methyloprofundus sp.]|nr:hypothetical protein [Methyloprofundus sp.]